MAGDGVGSLRTCRDCGIVQPVVNFPLTSGKRQQAKGYRRHRCADCQRTLKSAQKLAWRKANEEKDRAYMAAYREAGKMAESWQRYYATHRSERLTKTRSYYERLVGSFSEKQWRELVNRFGGVCAYCGDRPVEHRDHVVPVSRGGSNYIGNILPACAKCNLSKGRLTLMEWRLSGRAPAAIQPTNRRAAA